MEKKDLRIVFLGTPEFAAVSLRAIVEGGYNVVGVVTMPDKPAGRGHKLLQSPVKQYALSRGLKLMQPEKLKAADFLDELRSLNADLQVVVAFRMLPEVVWAMPPRGTFNLHASLLPQYRGAAPINWAIINGERETGVTTFFLKHEIDTGEIIDRLTTPIGPDEDFGTVYDRLATLGAGLVTRTVDAIIDGTVTSRPQDESTVSGALHPAPKIFKDMCRIDWSMPARRVHDFVRGLSPLPAAWSELHEDGKDPVVVKVMSTAVEAAGHNLPAGTIVTDNRHSLKVAVPDGYVSLLSMQMPGKRRMTTVEVLNGHKFGGTAHFE